MKTLIISILFLSFSSVMAGTKRTPISFDDMLNKTLKDKKIVTSQVSHLIEEADYKEKTKRVVQIVEKTNRLKKAQ